MKRIIRANNVDWNINYKVPVDIIKSLNSSKSITLDELEEMV